MILPLAFIPGGIGGPEIILILVIVLLVFGPKRLPEIAEAMGKSIRKFKSATQAASDEVKREIDEAGRTTNSSNSTASKPNDEPKA
ncbi:MAG TPA: twin-arginine translocase TatA/TatE family subunit [Candidatus Krumholzibacteria bacterium]|nr:twin-arginine translocase TatA/TatE family subunit [Candidatus Krumholzibacteria bacterium]